MPGVLKLADGMRRGISPDAGRETLTWFVGRTDRLTASAPGADRLGRASRTPQSMPVALQARDGFPAARFPQTILRHIAVEVDLVRRDIVGGAPPGKMQLSVNGHVIGYNA
jgi:hypothetical protein